MMQELKAKWLFVIYDKLLLGFIVLIITLTIQKVFDESKFVKQLTIQNALAKVAVKSQILNKSLDRVLESSQRLLTFVVNFEPAAQSGRAQHMRTIYELQGELFILDAATNSLLEKPCSVSALHQFTVKIEREFLVSHAPSDDLRGPAWNKRQSDLIKQISDERAKVIDCFQKALREISVAEVTQATQAGASKDTR
jgi:hypothetical protein